MPSLLVELSPYLERGTSLLVRCRRQRETPKLLKVNGNLQEVADLLEKFALGSNVTTYLLTGTLGSLRGVGSEGVEWTNHLGQPITLEVRLRIPRAYRLPPSVKVVGQTLKSPTLDSRPRYPPARLVYRALEPFGEVGPKVLVIGQDPYHGPGQAVGLAFASRGTPPPSLRNIYLEVGRVTDLETWTDQGVCLLNTSLTVLPSTPGSDLEIWRDFILEVLGLLAPTLEVILAWGSPAATMAASVAAINPRIVVVETTHPSPLSATRATPTRPAFIGSGCFLRVNEVLTSRGLPAVRW